jgi:hypothetical protein
MTGEHSIMIPVDTIRNQNILILTMTILIVGDFIRRRFIHEVHSPLPTTMNSGHNKTMFIGILTKPTGSTAITMFHYHTGSSLHFLYRMNRL